MLTRLDVMDKRAYRALSPPPSVWGDRVLPRLTGSASKGRLWLGVSAALAATGPTGRRAAGIGLTSLAVASAISNVPGKLLSHRPRPQPHRVPLPHRFLSRPDSSSFPSGHTASAVAFALAVSRVQPALTTPLGLLALGVAYGRLYTGVHYPGDILAGALIGAASAWTITRLSNRWPVRGTLSGARAAHTPAAVAVLGFVRDHPQRTARKPIQPCCSA